MRQKLAPYRTLLVLGFAQCFGQTASPVLVLLGGIVGAAIAPSADLATLPVAMMIIGVAMTTIPAAMLMSRIGRKAGFLIGTCLAILGSLLAAYAVNESAFFLFCLAAILTGSYAAFMQQFRFAVAESVPMELVPRCLSLLMLAGIVAGVMGPEVAKRLSHVEGLPHHVGSFLGVAVLMLISFSIILLLYRDQPLISTETEEDSRPLLQVLGQPTVVLAITAAVVGWTVMSLVMTATPVSMHEMDHHSLDDTTWVIQSHILAMYVPSLFSGFLIARFGAERIIQAGLLLLIACAVAGHGRPELMHYWVAMVLLGVGWNFLFVGGTTLLTQSYRTGERFKVQAVNDFLVFGMQAVGALGSGVLLAYYGWNSVIYFSLPWLAGLLLLLLFGQKWGRRQVVSPG